MTSQIGKVSRKTNCDRHESDTSDKAGEECVLAHIIQIGRLPEPQKMSLAKWYTVLQFNNFIKEVILHLLGDLFH